MTAVEPDGGAVDRFSIEPRWPDPSTPLELRLDLSGCTDIEPQLARLNLTDGVLELGVWVSDTCDSSLGPRVQRYPVGTLPSGVYTVRYLLCARLVPPPETGNECYEAGSEALRIASNPPRPVPAGSGSAALALAALLLATAVAGSRRRHS